MTEPFEIIFDDKTLISLSHKFNAYPKAVKNALRDFSLTGKKIVQGLTPVGKPDKKKKPGASKKYTGGKAKRSWKTDKVKEIQGGYEVAIINTATSTNDYPYVATIEYGSELGERPWPRQRVRTQKGRDPESGEQRIYSKQAVGGISYKAFQRFDRRLFLASIIRQMEAAG